LIAFSLPLFGIAPFHVGIEKLTNKSSDAFYKFHFQTADYLKINTRLIFICAI
jgi:hypothetical protein